MCTKASGCKGKNLLDVVMGVHLHVHVTMINGPQVNESDILHLSIPLCHNESLHTDGKNRSSITIRNTLQDKTDNKMHDATNDLEQKLYLCMHKHGNIVQS